MNPTTTVLTQQKTPSSMAGIHKSSSELFQIRLKTRLLIALLCMFQIFARVTLVIVNVAGNLPGPTKMWLISFPFAPAMTILIGIEYLLFKKRGPAIHKYSQAFDITLMLLFLADWISLTIVTLQELKHTNPPSFSPGSLLAFTAFAWRTLIVTLIVEKWQLQILASVPVLAMCIGYAIYYDLDQIHYILIRCVAQVVNVILVIYWVDKLKWIIIWTNLQQEKWMQVNNFILNNIPEEIMILDLKGEIQFVSDYCKSFLERFSLSLDSKDFLQKIRHLYSQQQNESVGIQIERLATENELLEDHETLEDVLKSFHEKIASNNIQERQFLIYNGKLKLEENQQEKSIEVKMSFVQHFENFYVILILRDTTQRDLLVTLEQTNKYKDQLLASVSHELRAPLNGNINLVEAATNSPKVSDDIKESWLIPALRSSKFLLHIINDILDMSQIKQQKLRLTFQPGNLKETLQSAAQLIELQAKKKEIDLVLELDPNLPRPFCTDHIRLSQIILNLLSNALKFTKQGTIKLIATPMNQSHWVKVTVEDSGIGISQENMDKLFSTFTHIEFEGRQTMDQTGAGLGLNIAHNLVQLLAPQDHQSIDVSSTPNKGSTFSFIIENKDHENLDDLSQVPEEFIGDKKSMLLPTFDNSCSCPKILIVDDNPFNTMALETILRSLNIKCDSVYSGSSAIDRLLRCENKKCGQDCKQYSVVFMDQEMPEMSGSETVQEIKRLQREGELSQKIHILGCTAHKSKVEVDRFLASGLDGCIFKPVSVIMIKDTLCEFSM